MPALIQSLILYLILGISYHGWGKALINILNIKNHSNTFCNTYIWLGWAFTLLLFQIFHIFFPVSVYLAVPIFAIGIIYSYKYGFNKFHITRMERSKVLRFVGIFLMVVLIMVWIALRSMLSPNHYDAGLYYFNAIRWINSFPIVPGLGNLHSRLAYNQSFFTYVAAINFYPLFNQGRSIANSFIFLLTCVTFLRILQPVFNEPSILFGSHPFNFLPSLFALPFLGYLLLTSDGFASPAPDLTAILLQLTMFVVLTQGIYLWLNGQYNLDDYALLLSVLAATSITIKLSNLMFASAMLVFVIAYTWQSSHERNQKVYRVLVIPIMIILVFIFRGFLLSGVPLYPSIIGYIPVDWSVPRDVIINDANWIFSWARQPDIHWSKVLGNWDWFYPWLIRAFEDYVGFTYPLILSLLFLILTLIMVVYNEKRLPSYLEWAILFPILFSLFYWFFTAPDPRFANALFFLLALCMILLFLYPITEIFNKKIFAILFCIVFLFGNLHYIIYAIQNIGIIKEVSDTGYQPIKKVPLDEKVTRSGLFIYLPETGDQCWDAPLPCTPHFESSLMLREPGNLASGFRLSQTPEE